MKNMKTKWRLLKKTKSLKMRLWKLRRKYREGETRRNEGDIMKIETAESAAGGNANAAQHISAEEEAENRNNRGKISK